MNSTEGKVLNRKVLGVQFLFTGVLILSGIIYHWFVPGDGRHSPGKLKVSVNSATKEELVSVPYIGEKTADEIIRLRNREKITDLKQLSHLRYYKKFKYYLKVE